ncbi:MAG: 3-deoxy-manno-octulosonate cytidylyltransferase [Syntrophorhabdaceae bacterium]|nr:3-deoxy-manno-octulosonate cytidylyltransferase [Syntrophorhabdaceae bacterium]
MNSNLKKVIVIPARYGSSRLPGKPLIEIKGKPLIQWVYEAAAKSELKDQIYIATDDNRINDKATSFGAEVIMTDEGCSSGTERVYDAIKDIEADIIINVQGDEPFIRYDMIDMLFSEMERYGDAMATLCTHITDEKEYKDPNTVKVVINRYGSAIYFSRSPIPYLRDNNLQAFKKGSEVKNFIYKHIGIYSYTKDFLERYINMPRGFLEKAESLEQLRVLENGYKIKVLFTEYEGFGIDTEEDLKKANRLL